jgi:DNA-binding FrmR family transcriptional regulator
VIPVVLMAHTAREKTKLLARVRRIRGQIDAVERAVETEIGCADVLQLIASVRGAVNGLMSEVLGNHIRLHVADAALDTDRRREGADELIDVVRMYLK